jgi:predicted RNA binding protein with dsRBD fold (UPF0201 family)
MSKNESMRTRTELMREYTRGEWSLNRLLYEAQTEAHNQAIEAAARSATTKNVESGSNAFYIEVDKQSILKLLK